MEEAVVDVDDVDDVLDIRDAVGTGGIIMGMVV